MDNLVNIGGKLQGQSELGQSGLVQSGLVNKSDRKSLYIKTFGCQMNVYDSDKLEKILEPDYAAVDSPDKADLILVNTCSVRDKPEQKLYSLLGEYRSLKEENPELLIGVGGCVAQQEGKNIVGRSKEVDFVFGTHNLSVVPSLIKARQGGSEPQVAVNYRDDWEELPLGLSDKSRVSVFVSISRGCNKNCTYCIVPTTRGEEVSRDVDEIIREIKIAVHRGAKEVVLLGQTVNSYGLDLNPRMSFASLLEKVAEVDGLERIRFTSPHPQSVRPDFNDLVSDNPKVCRHIHMPLQSGNDRVLKLMNRNYRQKRYLDIIRGLKEKCPDISITTDIIVGFPGETEQEFQDTLDVMREVEFDSSYSFMFSPRPGTKAAEMEELIGHKEKLDRLQRLQELQAEITERKLSKWLGKTTEILIDGPSSYDPSKLQGRNSQNILLNLTEAYQDLSPGDLCNVKVTGHSRYTLKGEIV